MMRLNFNNSGFKNKSYFDVCTLNNILLCSTNVLVHDDDDDD
jgi:hypothetical protein